jgi:D-sedoheptulose 7-phosphate isomerase
MNKFPEKKYSSINSFTAGYLKNLIKSLSGLNLIDLESAAQVIEKAILRKKRIFICGNGGSASISNHFLCDFAKYLKFNTKLNPKILSLSSNIEIITAISNDISYESIFSYQLENLCEKEDVLIVISSSGNSKNIIEAIKSARRFKMNVISMTGFDGGRVKKISDVNIHFKVHNYGLSEDCHHIMMHILCQFLRQKFLLKKISNVKF